MINVTQGTLKQIRDEMFTHMEKLPIKYFDTHAHGDIMSCYTNDTDTLDGGPCEGGMESTIVDLTGERPRLLRPGGVTPEELRALLGELDIDRAVLGQISNDAVVRAPGMKYKHYAPSAEVYIISGSSEAAARYIRRRFGPGDAVLCFAEELPLYDGCNPTAYGSENDVRTLSAGLFAALRDLDRPDIRTIYARCPEGGGVAYAVGNRLKKAAAFRVVDAEHEA